LERQSTAPKQTSTLRDCREAIWSVRKGQSTVNSRRFWTIWQSEFAISKGDKQGSDSAPSTLIIRDPLVNQLGDGVAIGLQPLPSQTGNLSRQLTALGQKPDDQHTVQADSPIEPGTGLYIELMG
jgi:hypothetical protein